MKLSAILLFACVINATAKTSAQSITLSMKDAPLDKVFKAIQKQSGYSFIYFNDDLAGTAKVNVELKAANIVAALKTCLEGQPLNYAITDKVVVIKRDVPPIPTPIKNETPPVNIKGRIVNENGEPLPGVTIAIKGGKAIGTTNDKGEFSVSVSDGNVTLVFSALTIETLEVKLAGRTELMLKAKIKVSQLEDVVVSKGYYTTTQKLNTGNVTRVNGEDIRKQPVSDPIIALEGRVPGLYISQSNGVAGSGSSIRLRGQNSIANGNKPLFIIDGVPFSNTTLTSSYNPDGLLGGPATFGGNGGLSPFNNLNPSDIESIEVLKDADATAIYGSRGANGVILITTKKGKAGKTRLNIDLNSGEGQVARMMPMMNTKQYLAMRREAFANDGATPSTTDLDLNGTWDQNAYTNWEKFFIGGTAHFTNLQAGLSGGDNSTQFFIGGGYNKQTTVFPTSAYDQKASFNFNLKHNSADHKLQTLLSAGYVNDVNLVPGSDLTSNVNLAPNTPNNLLDANGNLNWNLPNGNPLVFNLRTNRAVTSALISNFTMDYELMTGLHLKASSGYTHTDMNQVSLIPSSSFNPQNTANNSAAFRFNNSGYNKLQTWIIEPQISYAKKIGKGQLDILLGTTFQENTQDAQSISATGFTSDDVIKIIALASTVTLNGATNTQYNYNSVQSRIGYNWDNKYLLNVTARRDGSSRFGPEKQFGDFGAIGTGWIFSHEQWAKNLSFLSFGKLRGSYGSTGNDQLTDYQYLSLYQAYLTSTYQGTTGLNPIQLTNPFYGWETVKKLEGGVELGFLGDKIQLAINYYRNRTENQLVGYQLPTTTGFNKIIANLPAIIQNTGTEIEVNTNNVNSKDFHWKTSFNISVPRNKLVSYPGLSSSSYASTYQEGKPLYIKYLLHTTGVDPTTGLYVTEDANHDGIINASDRQFVKEVAQKYYGGFLNTFSYKGFSLDIFFQFVKQTGYSYFANFATAGSFSDGVANQPTYILNHWQNLGDNVPVGKYTQTTGPIQDAASNAYTGDYSIVDASFIRLKNLAISYELPARLLKKAHLSNIRIYMQGQNLWTITKYQGLDPETQGLNLPPLRMITLGISTTF